MNMVKLRKRVEHGGKKKCCRSKKRCKTCPVVLHRLRKSGALNLDDKALAKALANARKR